MPILDRHNLDFVSHSPAQTGRFGGYLGRLLQAGDLVCLEGDLGSGKTCLVQGIGQGLGIATPITSPSFALVAEHRPPPPASPLYHIDLYRLDSAVAEAQTFGLEDYLWGDGICVIEWADRIRSALPRDRLWVALRHLGEDKRGLLFTASGARYDELLLDFRKLAFGV